MLLSYQTGPQGFDEILNINGILYSSYKETCKAAGYLADDSEWLRCMEEAVLFKMPQSLRRLFAIILIYCQPSNISELWETYKSAMTEDFQLKFNSGVSHPNVMASAIININDLLNQNQKSLKDFPELPQLSDYDNIDLNIHQNSLIREEKSYDKNELKIILEKTNLMNNEQNFI